MKKAQKYIDDYKLNSFLPSVNFEGDLLVGEKQLAEMLQEFSGQQLRLYIVSKSFTYKDVGKITEELANVIKYLEEIKEHQMNTVQFARSTEVYKLADKALKAIDGLQRLRV